MIIADTDWDLIISETQPQNASSGTEVALITTNTIKISIPYYSDALVSNSYERAEPTTTTNTDIKDFNYFQTIDGWLSILAKALYSNTFVEDIFVSISERDVDVWVVIPRRDIALLRQLVDVEGNLLEMLVSGERSQYLIDFHIIYRCCRNVEELVSNRAIRLPR